MTTGWLIVTGLLSISTFTNALVYLKTGRVPSFVATIIGAIMVMLILIVNN